MSEKKENTSDAFATVEQTLNRTEQFIDDNKKSLLVIVAVISGIVLAYFGYINLYKEPKEIKASEEVYLAQSDFAKDSISLALDGTVSYSGFKTIADDYGFTKVGNLSNLYIGIIKMKQGKYQEALESLESFSADDYLAATLALGLMGDCYSELKNYEDALDYYTKACERKANDFLTPRFLLKKGLVLEETKKYSDALAVYDKIITEYPTFLYSTEGGKVEKYKARAEVLASN